MIRVTTQNIDFTLSNKAWARIVGSLKRQSDVILFQEAKWVDLHQFADDEWAVFQNRDGDTKAERDAHAGTAIMWRKSMFFRVRGGLSQFVPTQRGIALPTRYIAWADLRVKGDGRTIRFASAHYPPQRYKSRWGVADKAIAKFIKQTRLTNRAFVLGSDFNSTVGKDVHSLRERLLLRVRGIRIDGFIVARRLRASAPRDLGNNASDHNPVQIVVRFRKKLTRRR